MCGDQLEEDNKRGFGGAEKTNFTDGIENPSSMEKLFLLSRLLSDLRWRTAGDGERNVRRTGASWFAIVVMG